MLPPTELNLPQIFIVLVIASFSAYYANQKGRNPVIWFVIGLFLFFAPLIFYFFQLLKMTPAMVISPL